MAKPSLNNNSNNDSSSSSGAAASIMNEEREFLTRLLQAAREGHFSIVKECVEAYHVKNHVPCLQILSQFRDGQRRTALHFACQSPSHDNDDENNNHDDIVEQMLDWLSSSSSSSSNGDVVVQDDLASFIRLKDKDGLTPIMLAAQSLSAVSERRVLALMKYGGSKLGLARSKAGATALHYAAAQGATPTTIMALLASHTIPLHTMSRQGGTPLHWAASVPPPADYRSTLHALIDAGADLHACRNVTSSATTTQDDNTHHPNNINKNNNNICDNGGSLIPPPLHMATAAGNELHARFLVEEMLRRGSGAAGGDVAVVGNPTLDFILPGGSSIFHMMVDLNWPHLLQALVGTSSSSSTTLQQQNEKGWTALQLAAYERHQDCVWILLGKESHTQKDAQDYIEQFHHHQLEHENNNNNNSHPEQTIKTTKQEEGATDSKEAFYKELEEKAKATAEKKFVVAVSEDIQNEALLLKEQGNELFQSRQWSLALEKYSAAIAALHHSHASNDDEIVLPGLLYSNRSACHWNLKNWDDALLDAWVSRYIRPDWPKAYYRVARAQLSLQQFEEAAVAAFDGLKLDPTNAELKSLLQQCVDLGRQDFHNNKKK